MNEYLIYYTKIGDITNVEHAYNVYDLIKRLSHLKVWEVEGVLNTIKIITVTPQKIES